jgi:hypothetical protein
MVSFQAGFAVINCGNKTPIFECVQLLDSGCQPFGRVPYSILRATDFRVGTRSANNKSGYGAVVVNLADADLY